MFNSGIPVGLYDQQREEASLQRIFQAKQSAPHPALDIGPELINFYKQSIRKREKFASIGEVWSKLIPPLLNDHCSIEGFSRGTLTVLVDSSSHLYELKQLLLAGLQKQLILACKSAGLKKIALKPGRWYEGNEGERKLKFD